MYRLLSGVLITLSLVAGIWTQEELSLVSKAWIPSGDSQTIRMSIRSPNISINSDDVFLCMAVRVPRSKNTSYMVRVAPKRIPGKTYFILTLVCDEPGFPMPDGQDVSGMWDCGPSFSFSKPNGGGLTRAPQCLSKDGSAHGDFVFQNNLGPDEHTVLEFPPGTGYPVGGSTGHDYIIVGWHFPSAMTMEGTTGVSGTDVDFLIDSRPRLTGTSLNMHANGFVGPKSVGRVTGVFEIQQKDVTIHPFALYTHWHDLAIDVQVSVIHANGKKELLVHQDPHNYFGVTYITGWPSVVVRTGDQITWSCTINNTLPSLLQVKVREMCHTVIFYTNGEESNSLETMQVTSTDPKYFDCLRAGAYPGSEINSRGESSYQGLFEEHDCTAKVVPP